jgi:hypothetical protein
MRILDVSVPVLTGDIDRAIPHYEALTGERVKARFVVPGRGLTVALLRSVSLISGDEVALNGGTILQPPTPTPAGRNMVARDREGTVFEFVEPNVI